MRERLGWCSLGLFLLMVSSVDVAIAASKPIGRPPTARPIKPTVTFGVLKSLASLQVLPPFLQPLASLPVVASNPIVNTVVPPPAVGELMNEANQQALDQQAKAALCQQQRKDCWILLNALYDYDLDGCYNPAAGTQVGVPQQACADVAGSFFKTVPMPDTVFSAMATWEPRHIFPSTDASAPVLGHTLAGSVVDWCVGDRFGAANACDGSLGACVNEDFHFSNDKIDLATTPHPAYTNFHFAVHCHNGGYEEYCTQPTMPDKGMLEWYPDPKFFKINANGMIGAGAVQFPIHKPIKIDYPIQYCNDAGVGNFAVLQYMWFGFAPIPMSFGGGAEVRMVCGIGGVGGGGVLANAPLEQTYLDACYAIPDTPGHQLCIDKIVSLPANAGFGCQIHYTIK
ncbi:MAG: hypothetical protein HY696_01150 [Deltaproteobacteria bacterium]|nr:hypothetical protein [Deltaproteobacteria bacterium]